MRPQIRARLSLSNKGRRGLPLAIRAWLRVFVRIRIYGISFRPACAVRHNRKSPNALVLGRVDIISRGYRNPKFRGKGDTNAAPNPLDSRFCGNDGVKNRE